MGLGGLQVLCGSIKDLLVFFSLCSDFYSFIVFSVKAGNHQVLIRFKIIRHFESFQLHQSNNELY